MAFNGYRLKINNVVFPDTYVSKGTYSISTSPRVVEKWTDGRLVDHISASTSTKTIINFSLREHSSTDHVNISSFFRNKYNIAVEYYDEESDTYKTGTFHCSDLTYSHITVETTTKLQYGVTPVTLEEY